jgi:HSP20 family molecular chaperone IbpA
MPMVGLRRADDVVLRFDLPGIDPDSIEVDVSPTQWPGHRLVSLTAN